MDQVNQQIRLRDGRILGFAEFGRADGVPIVYFHGWPSSRLEAYATEEVCLELGVRMVAADRPGFGLSDFQRGRAFLDFTTDIEQLIEHLKLSQFSVLGISGGGPYAAACAFRLRERLNSALLVCSVAPADAPGAMQGMVAINRWLLSLARRWPGVAACVAEICLWAIWRKGQQVTPKRIEARLSASDKRALASEELRRTLIASSVEGLRKGVRGAATEGLLYGKPWGFSLKEIRTPVFLWHGEMDVVVPPTMGHYLAEEIPGCRAKFLPEDGHFSLPFTRMREIVATVVR